jgi:hypothetical protein
MKVSTGIFWHLEIKLLNSAEELLTIPTSLLPHEIKRHRHTIKK